MHNGTVGTRSMMEQPGHNDGPQATGTAQSVPMSMCPHIVFSSCITNPETHKCGARDTDSTRTLRGECLSPWQAPPPTEWPGGPSGSFTVALLIEKAKLH